jgi:hypothetical protein
VCARSAASHLDDAAALNTFTTATLEPRPSPVNAALVGWHCVIVPPPLAVMFNILLRLERFRGNVGEGSTIDVSSVGATVRRPKSS